MDYDEMLERGMEQLPDDISKETRFSPPEPDIRVEGSFTYYDNFASTAEYLNRDTTHVLRFFQQELATNATEGEDGRVEFTGTFTDDRVDETLDEYVEAYVLCDECTSPDTRFEEVSGAQVIRCEACGATNPTPD